MIRYVANFFYTVTISILQPGLQTGRLYEFQLGGTCTDGRKSAFTHSVSIPVPR